MNRMAFRRIDIQQLLEPFRPHLVIGGEQIKGVCVRLVPESRQQPEEHDAERVPVARRCGRSTRAQFRREIPVGAHHGTRSTRLARHKCRRNLKLIAQVRVDDTRNAEVRENRMALRIDQDIVELDGYGYIVAGEECRTSREGIFAAGDCRTKQLRQLVTAAADGAVAATNACSYIDVRF